jgi:hypothetical protein
MIKKILYWIIVVAIVCGAVYSYNKVGFGRKTAMLFQVAFGDANSMGGPGGGQQMGGRGPGMRPEGAPSQGGAPGGEGFQRTPPAQGGIEGKSRGSQPPGGDSGGRPPQGPGGGGPGGSIISIRNVIPYAFIFAFFVLITCVIEGSIKAFGRNRKIKQS